MCVLLCSVNEVCLTSLSAVQEKEEIGSEKVGKRRTTEDESDHDAKSRHVWKCLHLGMHMLTEIQVARKHRSGWKL